MPDCKPIHKGNCKGYFKLYTSSILNIVVQTLYEQYYLFVTCVQLGLGYCSSSLWLVQQLLLLLVYTCAARFVRLAETWKEKYIQVNSCQHVRHLSIMKFRNNLIDSEWTLSFQSVCMVVFPYFKSTYFKNGIGCSNFNEVLQLLLQSLKLLLKLQIINACHCTDSWKPLYKLFIHKLLCTIIMRVVAAVRCLGTTTNTVGRGSTVECRHNVL